MTEQVEALATRLGLEPPGPEDAFEDVAVQETADSMVVIPDPYRGPLTGSPDEIDEIGQRLFRSLFFIYYGGLERALPHAMTTDKPLVIEFFLPNDDLPEAMSEILQGFAEFFAERQIGFRVIQLPVEALGPVP